MIEITYLQMFIFITVIWILVRFAVSKKQGEFSIKRELKLLLVYICIVVIARFVYFGFHLVDGRIDSLRIDPVNNPAEMVSIIPFYFLFDRYDGYLMNIIGNIAMFIPVGIVWPICFRGLDSIIKTVVAGGAFSLLIELTQLLCPERHTDIDDLILNTCGVAIGAVIIFSVRRKRSK